ncbi:MAG: TraR/DksA C4-type zinc finger protein [Dehalococcoidales bacterium]|nr:TraR/DksA C4-type zinc finger protein [Dehalococcoidales bacterium]
MERVNSNAPKQDVRTGICPDRQTAADKAKQQQRKAGVHKEMAHKLRELRNTLNAERQRLMDELALPKDGSPYGSHEPEDTAIEATGLALRSAMSKRVREQLSEVERALQKLGDGTYGLCDSCGKKIPPERLNAMPQTTMCVECKSRQSRPSARVSR